MANHEMQELIKKLQQGEELRPWLLKDEIILFKGRIFLLPSSILISHIMQEFHLSSHEGLHKTLHQIKTIFLLEGYAAPNKGIYSRM